MALLKETRKKGTLKTIPLDGRPEAVVLCVWYLTHMEPEADAVRLSVEGLLQAFGFKVIAPS